MKLHPLSVANTVIPPVNLITNYKQITVISENVANYNITINDRLPNKTIQPLKNIFKKKNRTDTFIYFSQGMVSDQMKIG